MSDSLTPIRAVTLRSVLLGLIGVLFISILTPYNDFVVNNTYFTGNFLPIGLVVFFLVLILAINAPVSRFAPGHAFSGPELAVAFGMVLVSCAVPSSGLMRFLPSQLVGIWYHAGNSAEYAALLDMLDLPRWMFPEMSGQDALSRSRDPVVVDFWHRTPVEHDTFWAHWNAVPWSAWVTPACTWAILIGAVWGVLGCMAILVRRQWVENERLPFPLASLYVSLIEPPERGRAFNSLFRSGLFWIAFGTVFVIHAINALNVYYPIYWPRIPLNFALFDVMTEPPWVHIDWWVKGSRLFFCIVGITYFVQSKVAFSIWFCMILWQIPRIIYGQMGVPWSWAGIRDDLLGALVPFALTIVWIGRKHWAMVIRQMIRGPARDEPHGKYLSYRAAGWGFVGCIGVIVVWLTAAGAPPLSIAIILFMCLTLMLAILRIIAETGLIFVHFLIPIPRPWAHLLDHFPTLGSDPRTVKGAYFTTLMDSLIGTSQRENLAVYSSHALRVADVQAYSDEAEKQGEDRGYHPRLCTAKAFVGALVLALVVAYVASGASMLYVEYTYAATLDASQRAPINSYAMIDAIYSTLDLPRTLMEGGSAASLASEGHNRTAHVALGAGIMTTLTVLYLRYPAWPIHPLGYLLLHSWTIWLTWFSILIGWLAKVLILKFGGGRMFNAAKPAFIGLILGEAGAAGFWLIVSLVRVWMGMEYRAVNLLPM